MTEKDNLRSYYAELVDQGKLNGLMADEVEDSAGELPEAIRKALEGDSTHLAQWWQEARDNVAERFVDKEKES